MKRLLLIAVIPLGVIACDTSTTADPSGAPSARFSIEEKLPEGTQVLVALAAWPEAVVGSTFMVKGDGHADGAFCITQYPGLDLYLHTITLTGGRNDPNDIRGLNYAFSTPMPQGTQFRIIGLYRGVISYCPPGNPIYTAEVINGP